MMMRMTKTPPRLFLLLLSPSRRWLWLMCSWGIIIISDSFSFQMVHHHQRQQRHRPQRRPPTTTGPMIRTARRPQYVATTTTAVSKNNNDNEVDDDDEQQQQSMKQAAININEFSRTVPPNRIFKYRSPHHMVSLHIEATEAERYHLAERFDLSNISHLAADLTLMRHGSGHHNNNNAMTMIQVEGTCYTTVKQRCVRTNENFDVTMEFPLLCVVRPVVPMLQPQQQSQRKKKNNNDNNDDELSSSSSSSGKGGNNSNKNNTKKKRRGGGGGKFDELAMVELERLLLQQQVDIDEDVLMEDEAIYAVNGMLDVGELVAQLFWLSLDPYPKKPGTDPVSFTFTG